MRILIVRHGETDWNKEMKIQGRTNNELNSIGISQADKIELPGDFNANVLLSSPLKRARQTMDLIINKNNINLNVIESEYFLERYFGYFEGKDYHIYKNCKDYNLIDDYEHDSELEKRVKDSIDFFQKFEENSNILLTTHSHYIKAFLKINFPSDYNYEYHLDNCAIVDVELKNNEVKLNGIY